MWFYIIRYVSVGESGDVELFYYFVKSERNPDKDPLMIWLTGGPGCSSICALLFGNGKQIFFFLIVFNES